MPTQEQVACIFCGRSNLLSKVDPAKYASWSIDWNILQVRQILPGPGRGHKGGGGGFPAISGSSIKEMIASGVHPEVVDAIKTRLIMIVKGYLEAGIISKEDLAS